ncbi:MAG TPA: DUF1801 domain-containing protein [Anaerolineales bacterium]|nr:DUF1801 domain-containing protein [Anaerolineales bacterium]
MLPFHEVEAFLKHTPVHLQDIVLELRNLIHVVAPDAVEVIRWGDLGYFHDGGGGLISAGICQIEIRKDHIRLAFIHGTFLPDPHNLLSGNQKAKRFLKIGSYEQAPWDDLKELIASSAKLNPRSLETT